MLAKKRALLRRCVGGFGFGLPRGGGLRGLFLLLGVLQEQPPEEEREDGHEAHRVQPAPIPAEAEPSSRRLIREKLDRAKPRIERGRSEMDSPAPSQIHEEGPVLLAGQDRERGAGVLVLRAARIGAATSRRCLHDLEIGVVGELHLVAMTHDRAVVVQRHAGRGQEDVTELGRGAPVHEGGKQSEASDRSAETVHAKTSLHERFVHEVKAVFVYCQ